MYTYARLLRAKSASLREVSPRGFTGVGFRGCLDLVVTDFALAEDGSFAVSGEGRGVTPAPPGQFLQQQTDFHAFRLFLLSFLQWDSEFNAFL